MGRRQSGSVELQDEERSHTESLGFRKELQHRDKGRPEGVWEGQGETNVFPRSLYQAQLQARLSYDLKTMTK